MLLYILQFFSSKFFKFSKIFQKNFLKTKKRRNTKAHTKAFCAFSILGVTPFSFSIALGCGFVK